MEKYLDLFLIHEQESNTLGGSRGLVVMKGEVVGSNPSTIFEANNFHIYLVVVLLFEKT